MAERSASSKNYWQVLTVLVQCGKWCVRRAPINMHLNGEKLLLPLFIFFYLVFCSRTNASSTWLHYAITVVRVLLQKRKGRKQDVKATLTMLTQSCFNSHCSLCCYLAVNYIFFSAKVTLALLVLIAGDCNHLNWSPLPLDSFTSQSRKKIGRDSVACLDFTFILRVHSCQKEFWCCVTPNVFFFMLHLLSANEPGVRLRWIDIEWVCSDKRTLLFQLPSYRGFGYFS